MSWVQVARKDVLVELRSRETLVPVLLTGLLVVTVGLLAFHDLAERGVIASGVLWMGLAFAASLGLARAFGAEKDRGTLDTLLVLPLDRSQLYLGKVAASFATTLTVALVLVPVYLVADGLPDHASWIALALILALGALGLSAAGTMLSALTVQARTRDVLLPVLLVPLLLPLLISVIHGTQDTLAGAPFAQWRPELFVLAGYDIAFLAASALLFDVAMEG